MPNTVCQFPETDTSTSDGRRTFAREMLPFAGIIAASLIVRFGIAAGTDVFQDEAIYWWTLKEGLSFCPHPPAVSLAMGAGLAMFGHSALALRLMSLLAGVAACFLVWLTARTLYGRTAGLWAAGFFAASPGFTAMGAVATPDIFLLVFWLVVVYATWRAWEKMRMQERIALHPDPNQKAAGKWTAWIWTLRKPSLQGALGMVGFHRDSLSRDPMPSAPTSSAHIPPAPIPSRPISRNPVPSLWWLAAGLAMAAGLYAKYMMILAAPAVLLAVGLASCGRLRRAGAGPWIMIGAGLLLFVPVFVVWNMHHDWASVRYHLASRHEWLVRGEEAAIYVAGHAGLHSPLIWLGVFAGFVAAYRAWRRTGDERAAWVLAFGLLPILFFLVPSVFTRRNLMREHWDAFGYAVGLIGFAAYATDTTAGVWRRRYASVAAALAALMMAGVAASAIWPALPARLGVRPPARTMLGWQELAEAVAAQRLSRSGEVSFVLTESFPAALCLGFHLNQRTDLYTLDHMRNASYGLVQQLQMWGIDLATLLRDRQGQHALYIFEYRIRKRTGQEDEPTRVFRYFHSVEKIADVDIVRGGKRLRHFGLFLARSLKAPAENL
ncbi:MAG: glycosyltransferase family 39 protein [Candidatus Sumerlaeia bacterium]|nr:glycosyltransferase family 39 protein [Candidatus Sumerlaeia bacterium]